MKTFTLILLFLTLTLSVYSQSDTLKSKNQEWQITFNPTQLLFKEFILTVQKVGKRRISYEFSIGYRPSGWNVPVPIEPHGLYGDYLYQQSGRKYYNSIYLSIAPTYNLKHKFYFSCEIFDRYWWTRNAHVEFENDEKRSTKIDAIRNEDIHVIGMKLLVGKSWTPINISSSSQLLIKTFVGIGYRVKFYNFENLNNLLSNDDPADYIEKGSIQYITGQAGIKIGINWKQH